MSDTLLTGLITGGVTLLVCLVNNAFQASRMRGLVEYKVEELKKEVAEYKETGKRAYGLEERLSVTDEKIRELHRRLRKLEGGDDCSCDR